MAFTEREKGGKRMKKVAILSDIHLEAKPYNLEKKQQDIYDTFKYVCDTILMQDFDLIVIAGDLFDKTKLSYETIRYASLLKKVSDKIFFIEGNHDRGVSEFFKAINVEKKKILPITDNLVIAGIDWMDDHVQLKKEIEKLKEEVYPENTILVLHANVKEIMPYMKDEFAISFGDLKDFKFCIVGHFHNSFNNDKILIPGSLERLDVTNKDKRKLFYLTIDQYDNITVNFYNIPTRIILETDDINEIEDAIRKEALKPIVFFTGDPKQLTPAKFFYLEMMCLLFKVKTKLEKTIDELLNTEIQITKANLQTIIEEFFEAFPNVDKELVKIFITHFGNIDMAKKELGEYLNSFLIGKSEEVED